MGRPLNSRYFGGGSDKIAVAHFRRVGQAEQVGTNDNWIVSQRSNNKFLVRGLGFNEVLTLVDKDAGSLDEGEFRIAATDPVGDPANVIRLYNRTARITGPEKVTWTIAGTPANQSITAITQADPAVVTVASTADFTPNDVITISGVVGMTELNDREFTVNVLDATTFELVGEDSTGHTAYVSGGVVSGIGNGGIGVTP